MKKEPVVVQSCWEGPKFIASLASIGLALTAVFLQLVIIGQAERIAKEQEDRMQKLSKLQIENIYTAGNIQMEHAQRLAQIQLNSTFWTNITNSVISLVGSIVGTVFK